MLARTIPIALAAALSPAVASACSVCSAGGEESRTAFIVATAGMSVLPLAMIGGLVWWIWRRARQRESLHASAGDATAPVTSSRLQR
jgi:hypothetical protein